MDSRKPQYHPFEEIVESPFPESGEARLTAAETCRTVVEVIQHILAMKTRRKVVPIWKFINVSSFLMVLR